MRAIFFVAAIALSVHHSCSAALMGPGDIAFIGFNADGNDDFSFVTLVDIDPSTTVFFREGAWSGSAFTPIEGALEWFSGATGIAAGTVVSFRNIRDGATQALSHGHIASVFGNFELSGGNDELWAFLGPDSMTPDAFLAMAANEAVGHSGGPILTSTGLTDGLTAQIIDGDFDVMAYIGPRSGQAALADYLALIGDDQNWTLSNDIGSLVPFDSTSFSVSAAAVPEPGGLILAISGLLSIAATKRRRRAD
jgi:hypothetical protein